MPEFRKICDIYQGFNFKKDKQTPVGFISKLSIGDVSLTADQTCVDPLQPVNTLRVVGVCSDVLWELGVTDALYFSAQISVANKQAVTELLYGTLTNVEVICQFVVFDYDPVAKTYFKAFQSKDVDLRGVLEKKGEDLNLSVADDVSTEVQAPENYAMSLGIKPQPVAQTLTIATADQKNIVKAWGLMVG
jgi:hypothetical protein